MSDSDSSVGSLDWYFGEAGEEYVNYVEEMIEGITTGDPDLTKIDIPGHINRTELLERLCSALASSTIVTSLDLHKTYITVRGATSLGSMLPRTTSLQSLKLNDCVLGDERVVALAPALIENASLKELFLGADLFPIIDPSNGIGPKGAALLATALQANSTLLVLDLHGNETGDEGASSLASALVANRSLKKLDLSQNRIGAIGAASLGSMLMENDSLQTLCLSCNYYMKDEGAASIAAALQVNNALQSLTLGGNNISREGEKPFVSALKHNTTITELELLDTRHNPQRKLLKRLVRNVALKGIHDTRKRLAEEYDMRSSNGFVGAVVDLNNNCSHANSVLFCLLRETPEVLDRAFIDPSEGSKS